ncbi:S8 family serine peptidase [Streptomyces bobili]|uniref:S8 family serine peptidase n=1 Tax=Streptomyces bobili TaxID=67280 RepID=UPI0038B495E2
MRHFGSYSGRGLDSGGASGSRPVSASTRCLSKLLPRRGRRSVHRRRLDPPGRTLGSLQPRLSRRRLRPRPEHPVHLDRRPQAINTLSGTEQAAAHVAGVAAYLLSTSTELTPATVGKAITSIATRYALDNVPAGTNNLLAKTGYSA